MQIYRDSQKRLTGQGMDMMKNILNLIVKMEGWSCDCTKSL